jgi:hypothetical protein
MVFSHISATALTGSLKEAIPSLYYLQCLQVIWQESVGYGRLGLDSFLMASTAIMWVWRKAAAACV